MVVAYKMAALSFAIISRMVKSKYFSLPNLLADKPLVPELLQKQVTPQALGETLLGYLHNNEQAQQMTDAFYALHQQLRCDASEKAAQAVLALIGKE
jgi:lipid-A-disaccharide synthase